MNAENSPFVEVPDLTESERAQLRRAWAAPKGLLGWLKDTHHTSIGKRYIWTAFMFFAFGGIEALIMRLQLSKPDNHLVGPDLYNQLFTVHGTTMMFLFAVPVMQGLGLYVIPLMVGARNTAFPRLAAFSYWAYLFGGIFLYVMFLTNAGPDAGWFAYVPLSGPQYSPGKRVDTWAQMITFTEIAGLALAVNLVVTILKFRAPGMSLSRMPLFAWSQLVMNLMVIFGLPAIVLCSLQLALDRLVGTHFFNPGAGGDALLWQHLFWFFGHPEVYIIFVPGLGIMDTLLIAFCRREAVGYPALVSTLIATGFLAFGLWVHHMFATGLPQVGASFFTAASILIALPTAVQVYCWLATLWRSKPRITVPLAFALSFFVVFVLGGMTGVMLGSVPIDLQVHDTFFVVAHLHYVLLGGSVMFPLFGAIYYWYPKMYGRQLSQKLGWVNWALLFVGFNLTFFPMHNLGLMGMPRRVYTYAAERGWEHLNVVATAGAFVIALGVLTFVANLVVTRFAGAPAGNNPWDSDTLEWGTSSPPPPWNFDFPPTVSARHPLWNAPVHQPVVTGLRFDRPEMLVTRLMDAEPHHRMEQPSPTLIPLVAGMGIAGTWVSAIFTPWGVVVGGALTGLALIFWFWPQGDVKSLHAEQP